MRLGIFMTMKGGIIDGHCHLWKRDSVERTWLTPKFGPLYRSFTPADFLQAATMHSVTRCVLIESGATAEDNQAMEQMAASADVVGVFLPYVDLASATLEKQLDIWQLNPKFRGVRAQFEGHPDPDILTRAPITDGLRKIVRRGLVFEFIVRVGHLQSLLSLYENIPELKGVINHMAKPDMIAGEEREHWRSFMRALASNTPIACKLSLSPRVETIDEILGAIGSGWPVEAIKPYVQFLMEQFGARRLMWGSDWPVCLLASSYGDTLNAIREAIGPLANAEEQCIFSTTAAKFYSLQETDTQGREVIATP